MAHNSHLTREELGSCLLTVYGVLKDPNYRGRAGRGRMDDSNIASFRTTWFIAYTNPLSNVL